MAEITAALVMKLREITGLPMMDCKEALKATDGDLDKATDWLRIKGKKWQDTKAAGRSTSTGRIGVFADLSPDGSGAMVDLRCETAPVANNEHFIALVNALAQQLAKGPGAKTTDELLDQPSPSHPGQTLRQQFDDLNNRIREKFVLERIVRVDGPTAGYAHHTGGVGVILQVENGAAELAKDICMHIAAMRPKVVGKEHVDADAVAKEREILGAAARAEGKPEKIIEKMVEGRLKDFYAQQCLLEQPHANAAKYEGKTIGELAKAAGMKVHNFVHWELPKE